MGIKYIRRNYKAKYNQCPECKTVFEVHPQFTVETGYCDRCGKVVVDINHAYCGWCGNPYVAPGKGVQK